MKNSNKKITSKELDAKFDSGEDIWEYLDISKAKACKQVKRVNIDFPASMLNKIDNEAHKIGVARSALIKLWLSEKLEHV